VTFQLFISASFPANYVPPKKKKVFQRNENVLARKKGKHWMHLIWEQIRKKKMLNEKWDGQQDPKRDRKKIEINEKGN
jgi:hypothetical protein